MLAAAHLMKRVDRLCDGPSPREPVSLQQRLPALIGDVRGHAMEEFDWRVSAIRELVGAENLCHQAIFMNHAPCAVTPLDPELIQVCNAVG